jgi:tripeptidyl-peptidase-1
VTLIGVPVSRANNLLGASYQLYHHAGTNETVLRTLSYGLPEALLEHVQTIVPTTHFGFPRASWQKASMRPDEATRAPPNATAEDSEFGTALSRRIQYVTPDLLRWLYRTSAYVPTAANWNVVGVSGFSNQYPSPGDLMQFMKELRTDGTYATYTVITINGLYNPNIPDQEANLDVQYSLGIAYPIRLIFYSTGNINRGDPLTAWLEYMLDQEAVPQTITTSYGTEEYRYPPEYTTYACNLFARLGARGASVLASSGDSGVGEGNCLFNDGHGGSYVRFTPTFPSTCTCRFFSPCQKVVHR